MGKAEKDDGALDLRGIARLRGRRWVLSHIDLRIESGQVWAIAGSNGSGKTTLLRIMASLLPPTRGSVRLGGLDPDVDLEGYREEVGFLSHRMGLYSDLSAHETLASVGRLVGCSLSRQEIDERCQAVGLSAPPGLPVRFYSSGMRKRLALARLGLQQPHLILIDEPYGQLDDAGFDLIDDLVNSWRARGTSVVMASHLLERAAGVADRALILDAGQVRWTGLGSQLSKAWSALQRERAS